jgi:SAM-dependent methyltransferase
MREAVTMTVRTSHQQTWASGDFSVIATGQVIVSERLCEAVDLRPGARVLDVATGSGNTALSAARRSCDVTAIDWVPALLRRGQERAAAERLEVRFEEGDAERLPFPAASFDVVLSTFGAMFAPDQGQAARELLRVCRAGGSIGLTSWTPDGWVGELFRTTEQHAPPTARLPSPMRWGTETGLRDLFGHEITAVRIVVRNFVFRYRSVEHWLCVFRSAYGPTRRAFAALDAGGQAALADDLCGLLRRFNRSDDATVLVPSTYLEVVATRC